MKLNLEIVWSRKFVSFLTGLAEHESFLGEEVAHILKMFVEKDLTASELAELNCHF